MSAEAFTPIGIGDVNFLVEQRVEGCPSVMLLREFVQNGLEADGNRLVRIYATEVNGVANLTIWNDGGGMSADFLERMADLALSGKRLSRAYNFGMGAKVAGLKSNRAGIRYRSCHRGSVSELTLKKIEHRYVRTDATDVSDDYTGDERIYDWTEVVLMGNRPNQDTVRDPYDGQIAVEKDWVIRDLHQRFYDLPHGTTVIIEASVRSKSRGDRRFIPIGQQLGLVKQHSTVTITENVSATYMFDPKKTTRFPRCALEHRGEMYDVITGQKWAWEAPRHGIIYGSDEISVIIHLPREYPIRIEDYRRNLVSTEGQEEIILCGTFAERVARNIPDWLREIINAKRPSEEDYERNVYREIGKIFRALGLKKRQHVKAHDGVPSSDVEALVVIEGGKHKLVEEPGRLGPVQEPDRGDNAAKERDATYPVPKIEWLETELGVQKHELEGRAGRFVEEAQVFFVNRLYEAIVDMYDLLVDEYGVHYRKTLRAVPSAIAKFSKPGGRGVCD